MKPSTRKLSQVRVLKEGRFLSLMSRDGWEFVSRRNCTGVVIVLAVTDEGNVILVEQFRVPLGKKVIEFPAGLVNDCGLTRKESIVAAARRELFEETGYRAKTMNIVIDGPSSGGSSADVVTIARAQGLRKVGKGGGVDCEVIEVFEVPLAKIDQWLARKRKAGVAVDPKIYAGLYFLKQYHSIC